jgi:hypothetical protein
LHACYKKWPLQQWQSASSIYNQLRIQLFLLMIITYSQF